MRTALAGVAAPAVAIASAHAGNPGRNGLVAFVSQQGSAMPSLYAVRPDGSSLRRPTGPPALIAEEASFSRDGRSLRLDVGRVCTALDGASGGRTLPGRGTTLIEG